MSNLFFDWPTNPSYMQSAVTFHFFLFPFPLTPCQKSFQELYFLNFPSFYPSITSSDHVYLSSHSLNLHSKITSFSTRWDRRAHTEGLPRQEQILQHSQADEHVSHPELQGAVLSFLSLASSSTYYSPQNSPLQYPKLYFRSHLAYFRIQTVIPALHFMPFTLPRQIVSPGNTI